MASLDAAPYRWRAIRVFISSTFRDLHAERDYLVRYTIPELRDWCERFRLHLVDIDLRWGVTAAEAESGRVLEICLGEIDGCRPFFVGLLGGRYGFIPRRGEVPEHVKATYGDLSRRLDRSITHLEIDHAVLSPMRADAIPDAHAYFYFRGEESLPAPDSIAGWEAADRERYRTTFFEHDQSSVRRLAALKDDIRHYFAARGLLDQHVFTYHSVFNQTAPNAEDGEFKGRLQPASLGELGERIRADLQHAIKAEFRERVSALTTTPGALMREAERDYHDAFAEMRTRLFIGRSAVMSRLRQFAASPSTGSLAVFGAPGSGKSALLAAVYRELQAKSAQQHTQVIGHFVGASALSTSLPSLLRRLCEEINVEQELKEFIPAEADRLPETLRKILGIVRRRTILVLDGLNQLDELAADPALSWLPTVMPSQVRVIASSQNGPLRETLERRCTESLDLPPLDLAEQHEIVRSLPAVFAKTLDERHISALLSNVETTNPLYLRVALEELRVFGSFEGLEEQIRALPANLEGMFTRVLERLERDTWDCSGLVERIFSLMACSRHGLSGKEMAELMRKCDPGQRHRMVLRSIRDYLQPRGELIDFFHQSLAKAVRRKYLAEDSRKWHAELAAYFGDQAVKDEAGRWNIRKLTEQPAQECQSGNTEHLERTLFNLEFIDAKCRAGLQYDLLTDYVRAERLTPALDAELAEKERRRAALRKFGAELTEYARDPLGHAPPAAPPLVPLTTSGEEPAARLRAWSRFTGDHIAQFAGHESILQIAYNSAASGFVADAARDAVCVAAPWVRQITRNEPLERPAFATSMPSRGLSSQLALTADGQMAVSADISTAYVWDLEGRQLLREMKSYGRLVSIRPDGRLAVFAGPRLIALDTGECLREITTGHQRIEAMAATPDCRIVLLLGGNWIEKTPQLWDFGTGKKIRDLGESTKRYADTVALSADARTALIPAEYGLEVWDVTSGTRRFHFAGGSFRSLAISHDGQKGLALYSLDQALIRIWDLDQGKLIREFREDGLFLSVAATPDLGRIAAASTDGRIRLWDGLSGELVRAFADPGRAEFRSLALLSDGSGALAAEALAIHWIDLTGQCAAASPGPVQEFELRPARKAPSVVVARATDIREVACCPGAVDRVLGLPQQPMSVGRGMVMKGDTAITAGEHSMACWNLREGCFDHAIETPKQHDCTGWWRYRLVITPDLSRAFFDNYVNRKDDQSIRCGYLIGWNLRDRVVLGPCQGEVGSIVRVQLTPSGDRAVTADGNGTVAVWDLTTLRLLRTMPSHDICGAVVVSPDGKLAASISGGGSRDRSIKIWNLERGELMKTLEGHSNRTDLVFFSPDGLTLWSQGIGYGAYTLRWRIGSDEQPGILPFGGHIDTSPDGRLFLCSGLRVVLADSGETIATYQTSQGGMAAAKSLLPWIAHRTSGGRLDILHVDNLSLGPAIVTPVRRWLFEPSRWEAAPTFACPLCGARKAANDRVLNAIESIHRNARLTEDALPCCELPEDAWQDARLLADCPACNGPLRFNPFIAGTGQR